MYLNPDEKNMILTYMDVEPKHKMYLNIVCNPSPKPLIMVEPKHKMYLNNNHGERSSCND